jgi:hypothetical protein
VVLEDVHARRTDSETFYQLEYSDGQATLSAAVARYLMAGVVEDVGDGENSIVLALLGSKHACHVALI